MRATLALLFGTVALPALADALPSWNDGASKQAITAFVEAVTDSASPDYVPPDARIAVFDNDGTLWAEQPMYFQLMFALDRLKERVAADPSLLQSDAIRAAAEGDLKAVAAGGMAGIAEIVAATHTDLDVEAFQAAVSAWAESARNPTSCLRYADMTYQPMTELLRYLRDEGFRTYIVTGGGIQFVRALAGDAYGIPQEQVVGSMLANEYVVTDGTPRIIQKPEIDFVDDKGGKPVGIARAIGRRPILAFGNSDGDFEMLEYTTGGEGARLGLLLHHTDGVREYAYDRDSHIGKLARGLDEAEARGWVVVDMAEDWSRVFTGGERAAPGTACPG